METLNKKEFEGYKECIIPERKEKSCCGCKWYEHVLVRSGMHPLYISNCNHDKSPKNCNNIYKYGNIGDSNQTPDWCPVGERKEFNN